MSGTARGGALIVSHSFGYGDDLMYWGEVFHALSELVPDLAIGISSGTQWQNPHNLRLIPLFRQLALPLPGHGGYARKLYLPTPGLLWRIWRLKPRVIVTVEFTPTSLLAFAASLFLRGTKRVILVESDPTARSGSQNRLVLAAKRWAVRRADMVQTNNQAGREYVVKMLGAAESKVRAKPYLTSRPPGPGPDLAVDPLRIRLLFANSLVKRKGARHLLDAFASVAPDLRKRLSLAIVGDGPERAALEEQVQHAGITTSVNFAGTQSYRQIGRCLADADILICPSMADYRSLSSFEGLAYGLALLVSNRDGAHVETVIEGETGFSFDPEDSGALAALIERLASDVELLRTCRAAALALYREKFSLEAVARNIAGTIDAAASR